MSNLSANESSGSVALWRDLRRYLKSEMDIGPSEVVKDGSHQYEVVKVKIIVTNTALSGPDWPQIVFLGVGLDVANLKSRRSSEGRSWARELKKQLSPGSQTQIHPDLQTFYKPVGGRQPFPEVTSDEQKFGDVLFPGQTISYEFNVQPIDIPYLEFRVEGTASRRHLFHYDKILTMPETYTRPPIVSTLRAFNAIDLHEALDSTIKAIVGLGPDTRLADLQAILAFLSNSVPKIVETQAALNSLYHEAPNPRTRGHLRTAFEYLEHVRVACTRMKEAIASSNPAEIAEAARVVRALQAEAAQINRATEVLMKSYGISDEEASYRYRGH